MNQNYVIESCWIAYALRNRRPTFWRRVKNMITQLARGDA